MGEKNMLSIKDAAPELGVSKFTVRNLVREGLLSHHRIGRRIVISRADIDVFLARTRKSSSEGGE